MQTLVVTGGCGFIGSHFVRLLLGRGGWRVVNLDKLTYAGHLENLPGVTDSPSYRFVHGDINDAGLVEALFREERPLGVINFAAESHVDRSILDAAPFLRTNVEGLHRLVDAARRHRLERFVQISTDEVYGDSEDRPASNEDSPLRPSSPYAASKAAADLLCLAFARTHAVPVVIVRSSNNYGPFQFPEKLIPIICRNVLAGENLPMYGDGLQRRDWLYVEDSVTAILSIFERGQVGHIYNVATGEERTNLQVVDAVCQALAEVAGVPATTLLARVQHIPDRPGHDRRYALDLRKVRSELGWRHSVSFRVGVRRTIQWYAEHQNWIAAVTAGGYRSYYETVYKHAWKRSP